MKRVKNADDIKHSELQEFARHAVWTAKLEETMEVLEDLCDDEIAFKFGDDAEPSDDELEKVSDDEPMCVAAGIVREAYEDSSRSLEARMIEWLAKDPEHWGIFNLLVVQPWRTEQGKWRRGLPRWVRALCTETMIAHYQHDQYGR